LTSYKKRRRELLNRPFSKKQAFNILAIVLIVLGLALVLVIYEPGLKNADVVVYQSKKCSCVSDWISHLREDGYSVYVKTVGFVSAFREKHGVPKGFSSCHTAVAGQYFIEGHVPLESVDFLFRTKPNIAGIALPGRTDKSDPTVVEMNLPQEVIAIDFEGRYTIFKPELP
jgi:hypothetical protein